jgi:hypothetical protein
VRETAFEFGQESAASDEARIPLKRDGPSGWPRHCPTLQHS